MTQHVDVLRNSGFIPRYHAHGTVSAQFYGGSRAYTTQLSYSFVVSPEEVMGVIAREAENALNHSNFGADEEE